MEIKKELNVKTHAEVAKFFIVRSTNRQEDGSSIPKKRLDEIDPNSIHIQKLTSTPGPGSHFMVVPSDVSEITSSDHDPVNSNNEMSGVEEMHSVSHTAGTTKCHQKSTPCNMSSTFVNPFEYQKSFNKKSRRWSAYPVKEDKRYDYITELMEKVIKRRLNDNIGMNRPVVLETDDPRRISRVLAPMPPPAAAEIVQQQKSRFSSKRDDTLDDTNRLNSV